MASEQCKACGMPIPPLAVEQGDDFCSTECARRYYGNSREKHPVGGHTRRSLSAPPWGRTFRLRTGTNGSKTPR
jgi:hypothetical protein